MLLPESISAVRSARRRRMQASMNLAYGSAMASICLTIPCIAVASIWFDDAVTLGLSGAETVLLALSVGVGILTVTPGRATLLQGGVHLAIFFGFLVPSLPVYVALSRNLDADSDSFRASEKRLASCDLS